MRLDTAKNLTTDHDGEQRKPAVPRCKPIKDDTRPAADDHGTEKGCPALPYEISDHVVPAHDNCARDCGACQKYRDDEGQYGVDPVD